MLKRISGLSVILVLACTSQALAADQVLDKAKQMTTSTHEAAPPKGRAVINFANMHGSIQDWRADGTKAILIQDIGKKWYRAEFMGPCNGLPFAEQVGFITDGTNRIDQFSSILVRGERCWFKSFAETTAPAAKAKADEKKGGMIETGKEMAKDKAGEIKDKAMDAARDKAGELKDKAVDAAKEKATDMAKEKAMDAAKDAVKVPK